MTSVGARSQCIDVRFTRNRLTEIGKASSVGIVGKEMCRTSIVVGSAIDLAVYPGGQGVDRVVTAHGLAQVGYGIGFRIMDKEVAT